MSGKRIHDYKLLASILRDEPELEQNLARLAARYSELHPKGLVTTKQGVRWILTAHSHEILGRPYRPGRRSRGRLHNYGALRDLIGADRTLLTSPSRLADLYRIRAGKKIHPNYVAWLLRERREEIVPPDITSKAGDS